ncbi:MAG: hypothetical protein F2817_11555 [Actinobacteria bacterium]|nr:hypothetical protein [Actinomycetota bacterium]
MTLVVDRRGALGAGIVVAAVASGLGPWITVGPFSRSGIGAGSDPVIVMVLGVLGGLLVVARRGRIATGIVGLLVTVLGVAHIREVSGRGDEILSASPGWGLYLVAVVGVALVVAAVTGRGRQR